jgi:hypothetical protein
VTERPPGEWRGPRGGEIREMWAALIRHEDGDEWVASTYNHRTGQWFPLIAAGDDDERMEWVRRMAHKASKQTRRSVRIVRFAHRQDVETVGVS